MNDRTIVLGNAYQVRWRLRALNDATSLMEGATGMAVTACISATVGGAAINAALQVNLTEGADGDYSGIIAGDDITTYLTAYVNQTVYERIFTADGEIDESCELVVDDQRITG